MTYEQILETFLKWKYEKGRAELGDKLTDFYLANIDREVEAFAKHCRECTNVLTRG